MTYSIANNNLIAKYYWKLGLNPIPILYRDKRPSIDWSPFLTRRMEHSELVKFFPTTRPLNFGIVHGQFENMPYSIALDFDNDHDSILFSKFIDSFPWLAKGRLERTGSGNFHIPLWLLHAPSGNGVIKFDFGESSLEFRLRDCQSVTCPSMHNSGRMYELYNHSEMLEVRKLDDMLEWCHQNNGILANNVNRTDSYNFLAPKYNQPGTLAFAVLEKYPYVKDIFESFGFELVRKRNNQYKILRQGGLIVDSTENRFYNFTLGVGGGPIQAYGYCLFGADFENFGKIFYQTLCRMAQDGGLNPADYDKRELPKHVRYHNTLKHKNHPVLSRLRI